jgi:hypothetical protein
MYDANSSITLEDALRATQWYCRVVGFWAGILVDCSIIAGQLAGSTSWISNLILLLDDLLVFSFSNTVKPGYKQTLGSGLRLLITRVCL